MYARPSNPDIRQLIGEALVRGWTVTGGGKRHYRMLCPNECRCIQVLGTSSSNRKMIERSKTRLSNHTCWES